MCQYSSESFLFVATNSRQLAPNGMNQIIQLRMQAAIFSFDFPHVLRHKECFHLVTLVLEEREQASQLVTDDAFDQ